LHLVGILFPHINDDARSKSLQRKLYIYQTLIQSILVYGAEVWEIRVINKILSTQMDVLWRSARKSRMERTKNEYIKEINKINKPITIHSCSDLSTLEFLA
jgi:hypothetical protein